MQIAEVETKKLGGVITIQSCMLTLFLNLKAIIKHIDHNI